MKYYANRTGPIAIRPSTAPYKREGDEVIIPDEVHAKTLLKAKIIRKTQKAPKSNKKQDKEPVDNKMDNPKENKSDEKSDTKDKK